MGSALTDIDRGLIESAKKFGVMREIKKTMPDFSNGVIAIFCADGDQFSETYHHLSPMVCEQCGTERIHPLNPNGGALVIPKNSPLADTSLFTGDFAKGTTLESLSATYRQDIPLLLNILTAVKFKDIKTVVLYVHAPCGAATLASMDFKSVMWHLAQAKKNVKSAFYSFKLKVPCFCHIDYGEKDENGLPKKRTYHIKTGLIESWLETIAL